MGPHARQVRASRLVDQLRQRRRVLGRAAEAAHAGVDLQMHRHRTLGVGERFRELPVRDRDAASRGGGGLGLCRQQATHDQDLLCVNQPADLRRLFQRRHGKPRRATFECRMRHRHRAVAVTAGLDDREQPRALGQVMQDAVAVGADGAEVDLRPAQRQSPPCRSAFMTSGISGSRSPASSPESPRRSEMRRPAAAWM